jgi:hypothetical protein
MADKSKNVYIVTFMGENYGTILQAYALQMAIKKLKCTPYTIRIVYSRPSTLFKKIVGFIKPKIHYGMLLKIRMIYEKRMFHKRDCKILEFCNSKINICEYRNINKLTHKIDVNGIYIAGSDQIWNILHGKIDPLYLLEFLPQNMNRYSYAVSIGQDKLSYKDLNYYKRALAKFNQLSVREKSAKELLSQIHKHVKCNIDPTLLHDTEFWKMMVKTNAEEEKYILLYMLRPNKKLLELADNISRKKLLKIKYIGSYYYKSKHINCITDAGIEDLLSMINNAEYILTNSFHGTIFSIQFKKKFITYNLDSTGSRMKDLLYELNLTERLIYTNTQENVLYENINYDAVMSKISRLRDESMDYLNKILTDRLVNM